MRIVGGKYRSRVLKQFDLENIRPTADNVRENLFNIIGGKVDDCIFLDMFCGTGACGIEALSRGAKAVVFNDFSKDSLSLTKQNLDSLKVSDKTYVLSQKDGIDFIKNCNQKFDIIYIDPPYKGQLQAQAVNLSASLLSDDGIIVCENETPFDQETQDLIKYDERKYGRVCLTFFRRAKKKDEACLFAGTFDPITNGHVEIVKECLKRYESVVVAIGINPEKNPYFSLEDRLEFIRLAIDNERVKVDSYKGFTVDYMRKNDIRVSVRGIRNDKDLKYEKKMAEYNKLLYRDMQTEFIYSNAKYSTVSSTVVRKKLEKGQDLKELVPEKVYLAIKDKLNK